MYISTSITSYPCTSTRYWYEACDKQNLIWKQTNKVAKIHLTNIRERDGEREKDIWSMTLQCSCKLAAAQWLIDKPVAPWLPSDSVRRAEGSRRTDSWLAAGWLAITVHVKYMFCSICGIESLSANGSRLGVRRSNRPGYIQQKLLPWQSLAERSLRLAFLNVAFKKYNIQLQIQFRGMQWEPWKVKLP